MIRRRISPFLACLLTIAFGLVLRRFGYAVHLPFEIVKNGGSILWGAMVYWLLVTALPGARRITTTSAAMIVAALIEFSRLWHTPALDAFRLTTAGALLLGRVFSPWNILAYAIGIAAAFALDWALSKR
ncbi:DUF2809 domain-containing protein [Rhizobium sp. BR 314]|uniref:ribosomal maturation YjgA family protein n=1 Tax=Rhizobium sp. BR 314 TaxID=3040013 RepID=UPI0039BEFF54